MNNTKVISLPASTNFTPKLALKSALDLTEEGLIEDVLIVGFDNEGALFIRSSRMSRSDALFMLEKAKDWAMNGGNGNYEDS